MDFSEKIESYMSKISELRVFIAVRRGFMLIIPLILIGSAATVINNFPVSFYQDFMVSFFGENWTDFGSYLYQATFAIMSLSLVITISYSYASLEPYNSSYESNPPISSVVSLICLFAILYTENDTVSFRNLGVMGVFIAIVTALVSSFLFTLLLKIQAIKLHIDSNASDPNVSMVFASLFPAAITVCLFISFRITLSRIGIENIHESFYKSFESIFFEPESSLKNALVFITLIHSLWFLGIHGSNMLESVTQSVFVPCLQSNIELVASGQAPVHIFTKEFFDIFVLMGGSGTTLCLVVAFLLRSRKSNAQNVSVFSLFPGLFNINESMLFGIPVVLNFYLLIPFILTPIVLTLITYGAMSIGLVPLVTSSVQWTTPIFLGGYKATGSLAGALLQGVNFIIGVMIYLPFVKINEESTLKKNKLIINSLIDLALERQDGISRNLIQRKDAIGSLARNLSVDLRQDMIKGTGLWLEYQPKINYEGNVVGIEALLRWKHRLFGLLPPPLAIALAEDREFIHLLGGWIFEEACKQLKSWEEQGLKDVTLSVNISPLQMDKNIIISQFDGITKKFGIKPHNIEIEITEQAALNQIRSALEIIGKLKEMGFKIAIDDFGMGHTSLVILKEFSIDTIKIDGSLVKDMMNHNSSRDIISSIVYLARKSNFSVVAEYVQTEEQRDLLHSLGCDIYQGWLYSKALMPEALFDYYIRSLEITGNLSKEYIKVSSTK